MEKEVKISQNRQKKEKLVAEMVEKAAKSKAIVLTDYKGLTHQQLEGFKKQLHDKDAEFAVTKNKLLKLALKEAAVEVGDEQNYEQPTGTLFMYGDPVEPLKAMAKLIKELDKPVVKYGVLDKKGITKAQVMQLATLPSKEVLIAQLLGMMNAPLTGLHRALSWNLQKFVMTLNAVAEKKQATA